MGIAGEILEQLMKTAEENEWQSITLNITAGPKESPQIIACIIPGTSEKNAKRIQAGCSAMYDKMNK